MSHHFDVCVIGSANLDLVAVADRLPRPGETVLGTDYAEHPGGKGLNQAVAAARTGAATAMIAAVGDDAAGRALLSVLHEEGIDASGVSIVAGPTGRALIGVDASAENSIIVVPAANASVSPDTVASAADSVTRARVVLAQLEISTAAVVAAFARARAAAAITVLNPAPAAELPDELLSLCQVIVPNEHEVQQLGGVDRLRRHAGLEVIVTRGAAGADVYRSGNVGPVHVVAPRVDAVDTTGAGDAFCGSLAARLAAGDTLEAATAYAVAAGAVAATRAGAVPSLPRRDEVLRLLSDHAE